MVNVMPAYPISTRYCLEKHHYTLLPLLCLPYREILPDLDQKIKGKTLTNGTFTCDIRGIYFFSYHISAKSRVSQRLSLRGV